MKRTTPQTSFVSDISKKEYPLSERVNVNTLKKSLIDFVVKTNPGVTSASCLSVTELNRLRHQFIANTMEEETKDLSELEKMVLEKIKNNITITDKLDADEKLQQPTTGQHIADRVATFGGSWRFIILFGLFILVWITINIIFLASKAFDPYPFILLNLILSCLAALQAPVIMMSQNRQEEKDRDRSKNDYMINLKSELEIRLLHEKLDHLIVHQQSKLLEIQEIQVEMLNDVLEKVSGTHG
jgi:uncharacterized membrane protein